MSRLYLVFLLCSFSVVGFSQGELSRYLSYAKEKHESGDYIYALEYYEKALKIDSNTIDILWNYAETLRAYKEYRKAEMYYKKVFEREETRLYPESLLQWGLMQKQNGKYDEAIETFKIAKKKYTKDKKSYAYLKSKRELESCLWAKSAMRDSLDLEIYPLPGTVNTENSEFGHSIYDGKLIFSSLRGDSIHANEEVYSKEYKTRLFQSDYKTNTFEQSSKIEALVFDKLNTGNGSFSMDGSRFYFSICAEKGFNYTCKIAVARYSNGKWNAVDTLGDIINEEGTNTSMPRIGQIDGEEVLFFASDREGGEGGMDIYYSFIRNGNQYQKVKNLKKANSIDNDISPFWDNETQRLYFSSTWHDGFGGFDVFYVPFLNGRFEDPVNIGLPYNSPANESYFFNYKDTSYVSSNRLGVKFAKNPTCCSDIFALHKPVKIEVLTPEEIVTETLEELNKRLPVTLYFHNDVPNPKSTATTSNVNYIDSYNDYIAMIPTYSKEYSKGLSGDKVLDAQEDIESFFLEYVEQGVKDLNLFRDLMLKELEKGTSLELTVKGFASPLAKTDYNVNLTKRRIASLVNYLKEYEGGIFSPYLNHTAKNGAKITIKEVPFGEYTADKFISDNPNDQKNSIYSRAASLERKIEIQSISIVQQDSISDLSADLQLQNLGKISTKTTVNFTVRNQSSKVITLLPAEIPCDCNTVEMPKTQLVPNETMEVKISFDPSNYSGKVVKSVYLRAEGNLVPLRLVLTAEVDK